MSNATLIDWQLRVMEIRKSPETATLDEIVKLTDDYFMRLYFGDPIQHHANYGHHLTASVKNVTEQ